MSLAIVCKKEFSGKERLRGELYFRQGRVNAVAVADDSAYAVVRGSQEYEVRIDWGPEFTSDDEVGVACECPYFEDHGSCKHVWALMLELDRRGAGQELQGTYWLVTGDGTHGVEFDVADDYVSQRPANNRRAPRTGGEPPTSDKSCSWKTELQQLKSLAPQIARPTGLWDAQASQRQVLYAIDVTASHQAHALVMRLLQQERKRDGEFGKPTKLTLSRENLEAFRATPDYAALKWLAIAAAPATNLSYSYYNSYSTSYSDFTLPDVALPELLPRLATTGRLVWGLNASPPIKPEDLRAIAWDDGPAWRLQLSLEADDGNRQWLLSGRLVRDGEDMGLPLPQAVFATAHGVVLWPDRIARLEARGLDAWLDLLRRRETIAVPYTDREAFLKQMFALPELPEMRWPENIALARIKAEPHGHLAVFAPEGRARSQPELNARVSFDYGGTRVRWNDGRRAIYDPKSRSVIERDSAREHELIELLAGLGLRHVTDYWSRDKSDVAFPEKLLPVVVQRLPAETWLVEAEGKLLRRPGAFSMSVTSGVDWFELAGECDFGGISASLPEILAALRKGETYVRLGDGTRGLLPETWLAKYGTLVELGEEKDGKLQFKPTQAMLLDALLASQETAQVDRKFADYRKKLQSFAGIQAVQPPRTFVGELRPYQHEGLGWMRFLQDFRFGGCLADDMGLGKTVQVLALLESRRTRRVPKGETRQPSLVVVPRSLIFNWESEAARFSPKLRILDFSEPGRKDLWSRIGDHDVLLTTYGTMLRDITRLHEQEFDYAILDEAQAIKNSNSQSAKASRLLRAKHRLALTGTPIENHLGELWSLIEFLNPGMLGKFSAFAQLSGGSGSAEEQEQGRALLAKAIRPFILRRTKQQVLKDLPEKTEQTLYCDLSPVERKKYNELRDYYRALLTNKIDEIGLERSKIHVLEALLRLRQASCHLGLLDANRKVESSTKLDTLLEHLDELLLENHKALVFSQFTQLLGIVKEHLDKRQIRYEYLDGQTRDRQKRVERFQNNAQCPVFLVSLKAGGRGLNLTAADYVFILDPWWNPAVEAQAIDRAHRLGQTQPVFAYRLIARDTVEEKILELQRTKRDLADSIIAADSSVLKNLTAEDLRMLLG